MLLLGDAWTAPVAKLATSLQIAPLVMSTYVGNTVHIQVSGTAYA